MEKYTETQLVVKRCIDSYLRRIQEHALYVQTVDVPLCVIADSTEKQIKIDQAYCSVQWFVDVFTCAYRDYRFDVQDTEDYAIRLADVFVDNASKYR